MPDCSPMQISIGGELPPAALDQLASTIVAESLGADWGEPFADENEVIAHIQAIAGKGEPLLLMDGNCPGGMVEDLEALCRELGLTYHRCDDGHYAYPAMHAGWRPGIEQPLELFGTIDCGPAVPLAELAAAHWEAVADVILRYDVFLTDVPPLTLNAPADPCLSLEDRS